MAAKVHALAALAEHDEDGLEFELTEVSLPEFAGGEGAEFFQVWFPDGSVFAKSPSLRSGDLANLVGPPDKPVLRDTQLPDGAAGRIVSLTFVPRTENPATSNTRSAPITMALARASTGMHRTLARVQTILAGGSILAVALSCGVLFWVVRRSLQPVNALSREIAELNADDWSQRIDTAGLPRELQPVVNRLNDLLARLAEAFARERRFTGDVAHEMRTPLAGLRAKLEVALARERTPQDYRATLSDCFAIALHLQRIVECLLHLARADAGLLAIHSTVVDVAALLHTCWQPLEEEARRRSLDVEWQLEAAGPLTTDPDLLALAVHNLLNNAVAHTDAGGSVHIATTFAKESLVLTVCNTGCRVPSSEIERVFERFWRVDASFCNGENAHCGLGLPLARTLIERLGGDITATCNADGLFQVQVLMLRSADVREISSDCDLGKTSMRSFRSAGDS